MNFTKEFLRQNVEHTARENIHTMFPTEKSYKPEHGERTPLEFLTINELTFYDESSEKFKSLMSSVLKETFENCYKTEYIDRFFPNQEKVEQCKKNTYLKYFTPYEKKKYTYILNGNINIVLLLFTLF